MGKEICGADMTDPAQPVLAEIPGGVGDPVPVPSGQVLVLQDVILDAPGAEGMAARFRFIAPAISKEGGTVDLETASLDMQFLCETYALSRLSNQGPVPSQIIISLADRAVVFGEPAPEATQFFEAYRIEGTTCIWEAF